jgi:nucleoid-associated protein YgaU
VYVVAQGDTLFDIARYELGKASRWAEIYELNRDVLGEDFDYLKPGLELTMPSKGQPTDSFTRQHDSRLKR